MCTCVDVQAAGDTECVLVLMYKAAGDTNGVLVLVYKQQVILSVYLC